MKLLLVIISLFFIIMEDNYQTPVPTVTPYLSPSQGGNVNVPVGQTGTPYSQDFIGPIPQQYGATGTPVSSVNFNQPTMMSTQYQTPTPTPVPTPTQPSQTNINDQGANGANVGDVRQFDGKSYAWDGNHWVKYGDATWASEGPSAEELAANQTRNTINSAYDPFFQTLDNILNDSLPGQQSTQLGIAESQGVQGTNTLNSQFTQGNADLATDTRKTDEGVAKNLQGLAEDVRNLFKAGAIKIGAMGAGDSSAANQYSYAVAKMGNQNRGKIMQQATEIKNVIADRAFKLKETYNTALKNLTESVNQKKLEIGQWFAAEMDRIRTLKAQGQLQKGQDLIALSKQITQTAQNALLMAQQEQTNYKDKLNTWAMNNSTNISELNGKLTAITSGRVPGVQANSLDVRLQSDGSGGLMASRNTGAGYSNTGTTNEDWLKKLYNPTTA